MSYLKKLLISFSLFILAGSAISSWCSHQLKQKMATTFAKLEMIVNDSTRFDAVFIGDSRIQSGINPHVFDSATGLQSYNISIGGSQYDEMYLLGKVFLEHHPPPALVILSFDEGKVFNGQKILPYRPEYLFYAHDSTIRKSLLQNGFHGNLARYAPFTNFAFQDDYVRTMVFHTPTFLSDRNKNICRGFINPHVTVRTGGLQVTNRPQLLEQIPHASPDEMYALLKKTISMFQRHQTKVILVIPPIHHSARQNPDQLNRIIFSLSQIDKLDIWDLRSPDVIQENHFQDEVHLNKPGADQFTLLLAKKLEAN